MDPNTFERFRFGYGFGKLDWESLKNTTKIGRIDSSFGSAKNRDSFLGMKFFSP